MLHREPGDHHHDRSTLLLIMLLQVDRKLDRLLAGQDREDHSLMKIQDVLDRAGVSLTQLEGDDATLLADFAAIQAGGGDLTADQTAQANAALARIDALDEADKAAIAAATPPVVTDPSTPVVTDPGTPSVDGTDNA